MIKTAEERAAQLEAEIIAATTKNVFEWLVLLSEAQRLAFFKTIAEHYCMHCGSDDPHCQCWNDE